MDQSTQPSPPSAKPVLSQSSELPPFLQFIPKLYLPLVLITAACFAWRPLSGGEDFWAHIAIGRWIVEHGAIPRSTLFLWTAHQQWVAAAWLAELIFYYLMVLGGERGGPFLALGLTVVCVVLPYYWFWRRWTQRERVNSLVPMLFVLSIWCSSPRFHARPEIFTTVCLALLYGFLLDWKDKPKFPWAGAAGMVVMFGLWTNLHGAVAFGAVVIAISAVCDFVQFGRRAWPLAVTALLCIAAIVIFNPRHLAYLQVLKPISSFTFNHIDEWKPFYAWPAMDASLVVAEGILALVALGLWTRSENKRWATLGWWLLMVVFFFKARRNLWLTALTSLIVIVDNAKYLDTDQLFHGWRKLSATLTGESPDEGIPNGLRGVMRIATTAILLVAVAQAIPSDFLPFRAVSLTLPVNMSNFVLNHTSGKLFNDYEYSAYHEWNFHDRRPLYIDLNNAYPDSLMEEYFTILGSRKARPGLLAKEGFQVIALRPRNKSESDAGIRAFVKYLKVTPAWKKVYDDTDGTVWVLTAPAPNSTPPNSAPAKTASAPAPKAKLPILKTAGAPA